MLLQDRVPAGATRLEPTETPTDAPGRRSWPFVLLGCIVLAALSLLPFDQAPTYDPWSWIVWGREITQGDLNTVDGPSWKPLPVLFTTLFAPFGEAAPALWLVVARTGALLAAVLAWRVGKRLAGPAGGAGAAAVVLLAPWTLRNAGLGNSEPLMFACVLGLIDQHLADRYRMAFASGVLAAMLRPECWPFLGLYALWLLWRERRAVLVPLAVGLGSLPLLWFLPEQWGSGQFLRAAERAQKPRADSPAFSDHPALKVLENAASLMPWAAWAGLAAAVVLIATGRLSRDRARVVGALLLTAALWLGLVAYMTKGGFSGSSRYLVTPVVLLVVVASCGLAWAARELRVPAAVAAVVIAGALVLPWSARIGDAISDVEYQGALPHRLAEAVDDAGGAQRLRDCGPASTGAFLVPAVAWRLGVHTSEVLLEPARPGVVFRVETNPDGRVSPSLRALDGAEQRTLAVAPHWRLVGSGCP